MYQILKIAITTILVVLISEISKRSTYIGAILASIPLISVLAMVWLYNDTNDIEKVIKLSKSVFWLIMPSMVLFLTLPMLLKRGLNFYLSFSVSIGLTIFCYWLMISILQHFGVKL